MEHRMESNWGESRHGGLRHLLPFLAIPLALALMRGLVHHKFAGMAGKPREEWKNGVPPVFAELHRRAHAAEAEKTAEAQA